MKRSRHIFRKSWSSKLHITLFALGIGLSVHAQEIKYEVQLGFEHNYSGFVNVIGANVQYGMVQAHLGLMNNLSDGYINQPLLGLSTALYFELIQTERFSQYLGTQYYFQKPLENVSLHLNYLTSQSRFRFNHHWAMAFTLGYGFAREKAKLINRNNISSRSTLNASVNLGCVYSF